MKRDQLPFERGFHVSWDHLHRDAKALAWRLDGMEEKGAASWRAIVAITRGGLVPAMIVARELNIRIVDTVSVRSYDHQTQEPPKIIKPPREDLAGDGSGVLVIDDLTDSGRTLGLVRAHLPRAHYATVYVKPRGRPLVDTFVTEVSQDTWVFFPWDMALQYIRPYRGTT